MSTDLEEVKILLGSAITEAFDAPVHDVLTVNPNDKNGFYGCLLSDGDLYTYDVSDRSIELNHLPVETKELNEYTSGFLVANGIHTDSNKPYEWVRGFYRIDALKCAPGNAPCGARCLPKGQKCHKGMGASMQEAVNSANKNFKVNPLHAAGALAGAALAGGAVAAAAHHALNSQSTEKKEPKEVAKEGVEAAKKTVAKGHSAGRTADVMVHRAMGKDGRKAVKEAVSNVKQGVAHAHESVENAVTKVAANIRKTARKAAQKAKSATEDVQARSQTKKETSPGNSSNTVTTKAKTTSTRRRKPRA
jgi:hypothetical protein